MVFLPSWLQGIIPPGLAHSSPLSYNQLFHNHLVEYTAVQGIFSINTVRLPWRQIAWCQLLHGVGNLQSPDIVVTRVASGSHSPGSLKGDGVWKPSGSSLGRSCAASACGCLVQLLQKIMPAWPLEYELERACCLHVALWERCWRVDPGKGSWETRKTAVGFKYGSNNDKNNPEMDLHNWCFNF